jgi:hypothetical protein
MNRGVSNNEFNSFYLKIKTVQNSRLIATLYSEDIDWKNNIVSFKYEIEENNSKINIGQHYKVQLAYANSIKDENNIVTSVDVGYYSTIGTIKCTTKPELLLYGLNKESDNLHQYNYLGIYN